MTNTERAKAIAEKLTTDRNENLYLKQENGFLKAELSEAERELRDLGISVTPDPGAEYDPAKRYLTGDMMTFKSVKYKALRYLKNQSPEEYPELWEIVPNTKIYPLWTDIPDGTVIYGDDSDGKEAWEVEDKGEYWHCTVQHMKSTVYRPKEGSSRWKKVVA